MNLNAFAAEKRLELFEDLKAGRTPREGEYDEATLRDARVKGQPQLGATHYEPESIFLEFIYPEPKSYSAVLTVRIPSPERIVFLPVPEWVVESIWQGEISGSFQFESDAERMVADLHHQLAPQANAELFGPRTPVGRS